MANKYLDDLIKLDLWSEKLKNNIIANGGSVQHITEIAEIREKYKTVWRWDGLADRHGGGQGGVHLPEPEFELVGKTPTTTT
jgi:hypothetical protein